VHPHYSAARAPVAQWIEQRFMKSLGVESQGSRNRLGGENRRYRNRLGCGIAVSVPSRSPAERWRREEMPANAGAWLLRTARNRAIDRIRRDRALVAKTRLLQVPEPKTDDAEETTFPDERLELIFTCCHPALALEAQVALTLRTLGGLSTEQIARSFLVSSETVRQLAASLT
jgi:hypothetical protein